MFGRNKFYHCVCACARFHRFPCSIVIMHDANVFRQFHRFPVLSEDPSSLCKRLSSISCERDVFPFSTKTRSVSSGFPDRSQIWIGFGLGLFGKLNTWCFSKRLLNEFSNWLLFNCKNPIDHSLWSNCDRVSMRSLVVVEETSIVFHTRLLQFSIFQLLECKKLEVSLNNNCIRSCLIEC